MEEFTQCKFCDMNGPGPTEQISVLSSNSAQPTELKLTCGNCNQNWVPKSIECTTNAIKMNMGSGGQ